VLLQIAAFLNQNRMLAFLNSRVHTQATELAKMNRTLESRVSQQVHEGRHRSCPVLDHKKWRRSP
jgi:hypothetical protein